MENPNGFEPIAYLESCYPDKFGTPRQPGLVPEALGRIRFLPKFQPEESLQGLDQFSHLWVVFQFHQSVNSRFHAKVHPPRLGGTPMGVFATRSPHRPNSMGLSLVEIVNVEKDSVLVRGVDMIDGTPIFDVKPYLPEIESKANARSGWTQSVENKNLEITWGTEALKSLQNWAKSSARPELQDLIEKTIRLDPRPTVYKGFESGESPYRSEHAIRFYEGDIHFRFLNEQKVQIDKLVL